MQKLPKVSAIINLKSKKDKEGYLQIEVYHAGKRYRKNTGHKIPLRYWNKDRELLSHLHPQSDAINAEIEKDKADLNEAFRTLKKNDEIIDSYAIKAILTGGNVVSGDLVQLFRNRIDYLKKADRTSKGYIVHLEQVYTDLSTFMPEIPFRRVNTELLQAFEMALAEKISSTTLAVRMRRIHEIIKIAVKKGLIEPRQFADYEFPSYKNPDRVYLTLDEIDKIANAIYAKQYDKETLIAGAYFIVECYCGIRHSDWSRFEVEKLIDKEGLKLRAKKNGAFVYINLEYWPKLSKMIDFIRSEGYRYNGVEQVTNRMLKAIAKDLGIKKAITTHVGRHSAATLLAEKGYSDNEGAEILGISPNTFAIYRKMTRQGSKLAQQRHGGI